MVSLAGLGQATQAVEGNGTQGRGLKTQLCPPAPAALLDPRQSQEALLLAGSVFGVGWGAGQDSGEGIGTGKE